MPVKTAGEVFVDWTPQYGSILLKDLFIDGPEGTKGNVARLLTSVGKKEFSWNERRVIRNNLQFSDGSTFSLNDEGASASFALDFPLALLDLVVPNLKFIDGRISLSGQMPLPPDIRTIQAKGEVVRGTLFIRGVGQPIENVKSVVSFNRQQLNFTGAKGNLGGGDVGVGGIYKIDLEKPAANLQINLNRAHVVVMDDVPADVTGDLLLKGEEPPYLLSGRVQVSNAIYSKEFKQDIPVISPSQRAILRFGIDAEFGSNVQLKNSVAAVLATGRMVITGTDLSPDVQGKVSLLSGSIFANETEFKIIQGLVVFPGGSAMPQVNIQANTVIKNNNQDYKIEMRARGSGDNLSIEFSSEPALSNTDIVNLLAFGVIRPSSESGGSGDLSGAARIEMLSALFGRAIGKNIDRTTGFQVRFKSAKSAQSGEVIPKVTLVKKLSDRMTLTVGRNLDITSPENNVQVDYKLLNNVNLTGVIQQGSQNEETSKGVDLRFRFEVK
jgi:translocation and assembly module TamB